jgi:hypothetical protein
VGERGVGLKRARTCGGGRRSRGRGSVHGGGTWAGGWGQADRWGRWDRERSGRMCERNDADKPGPLVGEGERERMCGRNRLRGGDRLSARAGARARAQAGPTWAKWSKLGFF